MRTTVRSRVKRGNIELLERIELPEEKREVAVTILDVPWKADYEHSIALLADETKTELLRFDFIPRGLFP